MLKKLKNKMFKRNMESFEITLEDMKIKQNQDAIIIDVRSSQEYNEGHLSGAINIPYYEIKRNISKFVKDKTQEIVVYCQEGVRSKQAYKILKKLNYEKVFNLYKGLDNWI